MVADAGVAPVTYEHLFMCSQVDSRDGAGSSARRPTAGDVDVADAARIASVFRVLGDPSRCRLVYALLRRDEICVGELAANAWA